MTGAKSDSRGNNAPGADWPSPEFVPGLVSIVIPCFNCEKYVAEAIGSALAQTYPRKEVIVIDDGSTDGSLEVIRSLGPAVRWETGPNRGGSAARNQGLRLSRGEFIQFLDADDVLLEDTVERRMAAFTDDADLVFGDIEHMDATGRKLGRAIRHTGWPGPDPVSYMLMPNIQTSCPLHRRGAIWNVGGFDETLPRGQETDLHVRLYLSGARFKYVPGTVCKVRMHGAETRLGNVAWVRDDPFRELRRIHAMHDLVARASRRLLTARFRRILAIWLWDAGRVAVQNGLRRLAGQYFVEARKMAPDSRTPAFPKYRIVHALAGPLVAEMICGWWRRLAGTA